MHLHVVRSVLASLIVATLPSASAPAHANMPPPPSLQTQLGWIIDGLLGEAPFAAWSADKGLVAFVETWSQEGTGQGMSVTIAPVSGKPGKSIEVYDPNSDTDSESAVAALKSKAKVALRAELDGADFKPLNFVAWPSKKLDDGEVPLPTMDVPSPHVTLEVKKDVIYASVPGLKAPKKVLDLKKAGPGKTHVAEAQGVFAAEGCPYLVVQVHFQPKDYTEYNALTQSFVVTIPKAPPAK